MLYIVIDKPAYNADLNKLYSQYIHGIYTSLPFETVIRQFFSLRIR